MPANIGSLAELDLREEPPIQSWLSEDGPKPLIQNVPSSSSDSTYESSRPTEPTTRPTTVPSNIDEIIPQGPSSSMVVECSPHSSIAPTSPPSSEMDLSILNGLSGNLPQETPSVPRAPELEPENDSEQKQVEQKQSATSASLARQDSALIGVQNQEPPPTDPPLAIEVGYTHTSGLGLNRSRGALEAEPPWLSGSHEANVQERPAGDVEGLEDQRSRVRTVRTSRWLFSFLGVVVVVMVMALFLKYSLNGSNEDLATFRGGVNPDQ